MHWLVCSLGILAVLSPVGASPAARRATKPTYRSNPQRAQAVKDVFQRGWDGYSKYAFPHDSLMPVSNSYIDDR